MKDGSKPAFSWYDHLNDTGGTGMTLRQWYKGMALSGFLAFPDVSTSAQAVEIVKWVSQIADAMIAEDEEKAR